MGLHGVRNPAAVGQDYLDELVKRYPELTEFKRTRNTLAQLNAGDLRALVQPGGYIRPVSLPFYTVTGRNQPLPARGFLLNLRPGCGRSSARTTGMC